MMLKQSSEQSVGKVGVGTPIDIYMRVNAKERRERIMLDAAVHGHDPSVLHPHSTHAPSPAYTPPSPSRVLWAPACANASAHPHPRPPPPLPLAADAARRARRPAPAGGRDSPARRTAAPRSPHACASPPSRGAGPSPGRRWACLATRLATRGPASSA
jgi:hypothetical protein